MQAKGLPTADFIRDVVWGKQAENYARFLAKGRLVAINGVIQTSNHKTNTGETRYSTDVIANRVEFLEWGDKKQYNGLSDNFHFGIDLSEFQALENDDDIPF
jgi:single-strand DNA-binding protein